VQVEAVVQVLLELPELRIMVGLEVLVLHLLSLVYL
jgi:hypothetical protein